mmetsp:Transcript_24923/g.37672  ORF Transcript_24923/g.37672 Transcript_24923/m.37672 type:complete len:224 (-) Transcript_24923:100-771(-)
MFLTMRFIATLAVAATSFAPGADADSFEPYAPNAFANPSMNPCCGNGTGDSGCRYFDFEEICGHQVCTSCADVPCGMCQQDCPRSDCTAAERESTGSNTRNACQDQEDQTAKVPNFGYFPNSCAKRFAVGSYNTVCGQNQLMSYQECEAAAMQKIVGSSARVRIVGEDKKDKFPAGCSFKLKNNGKPGAFYNAKWKNGSEHDWQQTGKPGRAHKKFQPVCLEQ